jgi:hypothetical protein
MSIRRRSRPGQVPPSPEVEREAWLRAVAYLQEQGLCPVVPVPVSWDLFDHYNLRVHGPIELPWTAR